MRSPRLNSRRWRTVGFVVAVAFLFDGQVSASEPTFAEVDAQVKREIADGMFLGAVVCAGKPGEILFLRAYGERHTGQPMQTDSIFDVASITKPVTVGTSLAIVMSRHPEIRLDDPLRRHLPTIGGKGADAMTIRQLSQHRSGLNNTKHLCQESEGEELVKRILGHGTTWAGDSRYVYSCLGIIRLSEMIARVEDREFGAFCRANIFEPLGLKDTFFGPAPPSLRERCVRMDKSQGLISDQNAHRIGRPVGNAGLFTTAEDLAKVATLWLQDGEYDGRRLFSGKVGDALTRDGIVWKSGPHETIPKKVSARVFHHTGYTGQTVLIDPKRNAYVFVLSNWRHPSIKCGYEETRAARRRIAASVLEHVIDSPRPPAPTPEPPANP